MNFISIKSGYPLVFQKSQLLAMGKYCLKEIRANIPFPDQQKQAACKPKLKLISNNKAVYERASGKN
jgi:hypothetical protein